jgi:FKBP-type peptidyl-prolyl cis-trans isomerase FkpA
MKPRLYMLGVVVVLLGLVSSAWAEKKTSGTKDGGRFTATESGLKYKDLVLGKGRKAVPGDTVTIHYIGWLKNGAKFDNSRDQNKPVSFRMGAGQVIRGWEEGMKGMQVGGKRKLILPPDLGYGARGQGIFIPPNATLMYEIELVDLR